MNKFLQLTDNKLKLITFVILPIVIVLLITSMVYLSLSRNNEPIAQDQTIVSSSSLFIEQNSVENSTQDIASNNIRSFNDLTTFSVSQSKTTSSVVALTSPIASNLTADLIEVNKNLDAIDTMVNGADQDIDNQILNNY